MISPDYKQGSIVNLMSSILYGFNSRSNYRQLDAKLTKEIRESGNVILLVLDGLGVDSVKRLGKDSFLRKHFVREITTVFPATTVSAITTFLSGLPPQQSGLMAWHTYFKNPDDVCLPLLMITREGGKVAASKKKLLFPDNVFDKLDAKTHVVSPKKIYKTTFNKYLCGRSHAWKYNTFGGLTNKVAKIVKTRARKRQYIYAYWPGFDDFSHYYGKEHAKSRQQLRFIDEGLQKFAKRIKNTNTLLLITADHGLITSSRRRTFFINKYPLLMQCLSQYLSGEPRALFCHVLPHKRQQFENYVKRHLGKYCTLHKSKELFEKNFFGLGKPHPELKERIADYILLLKENYVFRDSVDGHEPTFLRGHHGGVSREEMKVPLIKVKL